MKDINLKLDKITDLESWKRRTNEKMKEMEGWNKDRMYKMDIMKKHLKELQDKVKELDD